MWKIDPWTVYSNVGDAAVTLPVAIVCAIWLAWTDARLALRWALTLGCAMLPVGASKIAYYAWHVSLPLADFRVISGHTMLSTAVWSVALALQFKWWRLPAMPGIVIGLVVGALTGASRVHGHSHSVAEVVAGWTLGTIAATVFLRTALRAEYRPFRPVWSTLCLLAVSMLAYGHTAPFQDLIEEHSPTLGAHTPGIVRALSHARFRNHG
ncbi:phosphatase PAP2 family protein [Paraburkholderia phymatum]|uniref:Phosphoesterase, PA-phosphatase related n=1 Tax=Paraburkholderia phymatum (strain DSM 17167 / CIP 108236 / LMG 21445 / STM815) TaxID=391038 RepID=B2JMR8_PARP8|nr:phosphatase PAP2 family protein [Paraburkholderia phymatum]ACC72862.1 phosphoesterase, PA-phosphatase related [Paraburkholderia phymatum STM815]